MLLRTLDIGRAAHGLRDADPRLVLLGVGLTGLSLLASILEWGVLLPGTGHPLRWRSLSSWYFQGLFVGQMLPAGVGGDALRALEVGRVTGHGHALASLAGSRMAGTLGMAAWGVAIQRSCDSTVSQLIPKRSQPCPVNSSNRWLSPISSVGQTSEKSRG